MSTKTSLAIALILACGCMPLAAQNAAVAPADLLRDSAALKAAFAARIGRAVNVVEVQLNPYSATVVAQDAGDRSLIDKYEALPGKPLADGEPQKAGSLHCPKRKIALAELDFAIAARLLTRAQELAKAIGSAEKPIAVSLDSDPFCENFGWHVSVKDRGDEFIELFAATDGKSGKAQRLHGDNWEKVDVDALLAGKTALVTAAPAAQAQTIAGDGRKHDYLRGIADEFSRLEAQNGGPLALQHIGIFADSLHVDVYATKNRKRTTSYNFDAQGAIRVEEKETSDADCRKPFTTRDFVFERLPEMIAGAPGLIPPLARGWVHSVHIQRGIVDCDAPYISIDVEDDRANGNVEYSARGKLRRAEVK